MKEELSFVAPLPISVNAMYINQSFYNKKTKQYQPTGKRILTKKGKEIKSKIRAKAIMAVKESTWDKEVLSDTKVYMDVVVYFNKKGRDADNILKSLQDSLQGVVFNNDSQVLPRVVRVLYSKKNPRVKVKFRPVKYIGMFDNEEQLEEFETRCKIGEELGCSRYRDGSCSILKELKEGFEREEYDKKSNVCSSFKARKTPKK